MMELAELKTYLDRRMDKLYSELPDSSTVENGTYTKEQAIVLGKFMELESTYDYINRPTLESTTTPIPQVGQDYNHINYPTYPTNDNCVWDIPEHKRHCQFCTIQFCGLRDQ